jgi:hypothetical protein
MGMGMGRRDADGRTVGVWWSRDVLACRGNWWIFHEGS